MPLLTINQTCITTLVARHLAIGRSKISDLDQLRAPMNDVLTAISSQLAELQRYKAKYGELNEEEEDNGRFDELP